MYGTLDFLKVQKNINYPYIVTDPVGVSGDLNNEWNMRLCHWTKTQRSQQLLVTDSATSLSDAAAEGESALIQTAPLC